MVKVKVFILLAIFSQRFINVSSASPEIVVYEDDVSPDTNISAHLFQCRSQNSTFRIEMKCSGLLPTEWIFISTNDYWARDEKDRLMEALIRSKQFTRDSSRNKFMQEAIIVLNISCSNTYKNPRFGKLRFKCKDVSETIDYSALQEVVNIVATSNSTKLKIQSENFTFKNPEPYAYNGTVRFTYNYIQKVLEVSSKCDKDKLNYLPCPWSSQKCKTTYAQMKKRSQVQAIATTVSNDEGNMPGQALFDMPNAVPGVFVCTKVGFEFGVEYFFSYGQDFPKLELSWNSIDPRDMMQLSHPPLPSTVYITDGPFYFSCKVAKYGFAYTPYFEVTTPDSREVPRVKLSEPTNSDDEKIFWIGNFTYRPTLPGKHQIRCKARVWNTTKTAEKYVDIYVTGSSRKGRVDLPSNLSNLEQATLNEDFEIYQDTDSSDQIEQVLGLTKNLLNEVFQGNMSAKEVKADVDAGLGVYLNVAKNTRNTDVGLMGPRIINAIEATLFRFGNKILLESSQEVAQSDLGLSNAIIGVRKPHDRSDIYYPLNYTQNSTHIHVPKEWSERFGKDQILYCGVVIPGNAFTNIQSSNSSETHEYGDDAKRVNSDVVSFTFRHNGSSVTTVNLQENPVRIVFEHKRNPEPECSAGMSYKEMYDAKTNLKLTRFVKGTAACAYLNTTTLKWSTEGCRLISSNARQTICECNHLTAFALLMDPFNNSAGYSLGLKILTYVVCPASILGLIATLTVFLTLQPKSQRAFSIIHISACLFVGNFCILLLIERSYLGLDDMGCKISGMLTHYVYLTTFCWMGIEGAQLYRHAILVFTSKRKYHKMQCFGAYGIPFFIVGITALTAYMKGEVAYGGDCFCWLANDYTWSFFGPAAIMLLGNCAILFLAVKVAAQNRNAKGLQVKKKVTPFITFVRGVFGLVVILGLSWSVGFLMFSTNRVVSQIGAYGFTLLNGLQGVFMFVFYVALNKQIRKLLREKMDLLSATPVTFVGYFSRG